MGSSIVNALHQSRNSSGSIRRWHLSVLWIRVRGSPSLCSKLRTVSPCAAALSAIAAASALYSLRWSGCFGLSGFFDVRVFFATPMGSR